MTNNLTIHFDGLCEPRNPGGTATYGWLARCNGEVIKDGRGYVGTGAGMTNNVAEYSALLAALAWLATEPSAGAVMIYGDSLLVINQVNGSWNTNAARLRPLRQQAVALLQELQAAGCVVTLKWVPRADNAAADALSRIAYQEARRR